MIKKIQFTKISFDNLEIYRLNFNKYKKIKKIKIQKSISLIIVNLQYNFES